MTTNSKTGSRSENIVLYVKDKKGKTMGEINVPMTKSAPAASKTSASRTASKSPASTKNATSYKAKK